MFAWHLPHGGLAHAMAALAARCRLVFPFGCAAATRQRCLRWLATACLSTALSGCGGGEDDNADPLRTAGPAPVHVTLDGDSVLFGLGLATPPAQVLAQTGLIVSDKTASGLRLQDLLVGYSEPSLHADPIYYPNGPQPAYALVARDSDVVVLQAGTNDALELLDTGRYEALMRQAIELLLAEGRAVVLTGIVPVDARNMFVSAAAVVQVQRFNQIQRQLAQDYALVHAGWDAAYEGPQDTVDGIHLTQAASDRYSLLLADAIQQAAATR